MISNVLEKEEYTWSKERVPKQLFSREVDSIISEQLSKPVALTRSAERARGALPPERGKPRSEVVGAPGKTGAPTIRRGLGGL